MQTPLGLKNLSLKDTLYINSENKNSRRNELISYCPQIKMIWIKTITGNSLTYTNTRSCRFILREELEEKQMSKNLFFQVLEIILLGAKWA